MASKETKGKHAPGNSELKVSVDSSGTTTPEKGKLKKPAAKETPQTDKKKSAAPSKSAAKGKKKADEDEGHGSVQPMQRELDISSPVVTITPETEVKATAPHESKVNADAELKARVEADQKKFVDAQRNSLAVSVETAANVKEAIGSPTGDNWVDEGDAKNEAKEKELEEKIKQAKEQGQEPVAERLTKQLGVLKRKNLAAKKKRAEQNDKKQALETFELKARLCERKRTLETRIATLTKLGMTLQVETLSFQLQEINSKLKG
jgi:hypothetical protein